MLLTDSHCHLDFDTFSHELESLLKQCYQSGIHRIIIPAISPDNWDKVLNLSNLSKLNTVQFSASPLLSYNTQLDSSSEKTSEKITNKNTEESVIQKSAQIFACLGIHPWFMKDLDESALDSLSLKVAEHAEDIVAIGETGLDKVIADEQNNLNQQIAFFEHHLYLSDQHNLPVIIHHRRSHELIIPLLKKYKVKSGGVIHAFSGSYQQAKSYVDLGFKLGVGGTITYDRAQKTIKAIKKLPLESLLLETDAPSMPLQGFQGEDNTPLQLVNIVNCLNDIRPESLADITQTIENNIDSLFFNR